jgi:Amt family ammonium transporter
MTPLILFFIKYVLRIPLRMPDDVLLIGDDAIHGEQAYGFALGAGHHSLLYGDTTRGPISGDPEIGPITGHSPPRSTGGEQPRESKNGDSAGTKSD